MTNSAFSLHKDSSYKVNPYLLLGACLFGFCFLFGLWEWFTIGVLADEQKIKDYMFGTETMLSDGGSNYATPELYATTALWSALLFMLPLAVIFGVAAKKNTRSYHLAAIVSLLVAMVIGRLAA